MLSLDEAMAQLREEPSGVLGLTNPRGEQVGALISPAVLQEMRQMIAGRHLAATASTTPTRKQRKEKAAQRQAAEAARPRSRTGRVKPAGLIAPRDLYRRRAIEGRFPR